MNNEGPKVLVTGAAGFIGMHLVQRLVREGFEVVGLDNVNDYYDTDLKYSRLLETGISSSKLVYNEISSSSKYQNYKFVKLDIEDTSAIKAIFESYNFDYVCHLAAQAGVRYSIENPEVYIKTNINGFYNIIENSKNTGVKHLLYASSSSIYGMSTKSPFCESDFVDKPVSLYAATKKSNELIAHSYSHLFGIKTTGLRFFTVYGPWGRPDMSYFLFAEAIREGKAIKIFNNGDMQRDFTYIDDIVQGIYKTLASTGDLDNYQIFNIGNSNPIKLMDFVSILEEAMETKAVKEYLPMQMGDVYSTYADTTSLSRAVGYKPTTSLTGGIKLFTDWYKGYARS